jgi:hypothetical protein
VHLRIIITTFCNHPFNIVTLYYVTLIFFMIHNNVLIQYPSYIIHTTNGATVNMCCVGLRVKQVAFSLTDTLKNLLMHNSEDGTENLQ